MGWYLFWGSILIFMHSISRYIVASSLCQTSVVLTDQKRTPQILRARTLREKKIWNFFISINFTQIFRICPKMLQFLTYLLHKQIIEMRRSQNLRCPFLVPSRRLWITGFFSLSQSIRYFGYSIICTHCFICTEGVRPIYQKISHHSNWSTKSDTEPPKI